MENIAIVLAGGSGSRFGADRPKQFLEVAGRTVLEHSVDAFQESLYISEIAIVSNPAYISDVELLVERNPQWTKVKRVLPGGKERYDSSLAAIRAYEEKAEEDVNLVFHDAVRPLVSQEVIARACEAAKQWKAIGVAVPVVDTVVECEEGCVKAVPDRSRLQRMQTPQVFRLGVIKEAYKHALADPAFRATDDCGVVLRYLPQVPVHLVVGEECNIKLTYPSDTYWLEHYLTSKY